MANTNYYRRFATKNQSRIFFITMFLVLIAWIISNEKIIGFIKALMADKENNSTVNMNSPILKQGQGPMNAQSPTAYTTPQQVVKDTMDNITHNNVFNKTVPTKVSKQEAENAVKNTMNNITKKSVFYIAK